MLYCSPATTIVGTASVAVARLPVTPTVPSRYALGLSATAAPARRSSGMSSLFGVVLRAPGRVGLPVATGLSFEPGLRPIVVDKLRLRQVGEHDGAAKLARDRLNLRRSLVADVHDPSGHDALG